MPAIPINYTVGDKAAAQQPGCSEPNSSGMVLVVVIILAAVAGILAAGLHFASGARITQVRQEMRFEKAFFVAEAGIERAKDALRYTNLNGMLASGGVLFGGATNYGEGRFYVWARNNTNTDPNPLVDTDNIVIIRSTGIVETAARVIEAEVRVAPFVPAQADGAMGIYGTNTSLTVSGNSTIDGRDWNLPATFGPGNGTLSGNPTNPGVLYPSTSTVINVTGSGSIVGDPPTTNGVGVYDETYWYQFLDGIMSVATIYTGGNMGTRAAPAITMLPSGTNTISGNITGAGVLIIPGDATLRVSGNFHYEGLVILEGDGIIDTGDYAQLGTARIFGSMICVGGGLNVSASGTADIKYSAQALANLANLQVPAQLDMLSWKEFKASSTDW